MIESCGSIDFSIFVLFIGLVWLTTRYSIKLNRFEHSLKAKYGKGMAYSEMRYTKNNITPVLTMGLVGGFVGGMVGFGGGSIMKPALIK